MVKRRKTKKASGWVADGVRVYKVKKYTKKRKVFKTKKQALRYLRNKKW